MRDPKRKAPAGQARGGTDSPQKFTATGAGRGPRFIGSEEILLEPVAKPVVTVPPFVYPGCLTVEVGAANAGKTFDALRLSTAINPHGSIAYISFEGDAFAKRLRAIKEHGGSQMENFYLLRASQPLSPSVRDGVEIPSDGELKITSALVELSHALKAQGKPPIMLIVFDTVRASLTGNEDDSGDIAALFRAYRRTLAVATGAGGLALHHTGWSRDKPRERGSSAFRGGVEATFLLERRGDSQDADPSTDVRLVLRSLKVRDDAPSKPLYLVRRQVRLSTGETSCITVEAMRKPEPKEDCSHTNTDTGVLRAIANGAFTTKEQVRDEVRLGMNEVRDAIRRLLEDRLIEKAGNGKPFRPTASGVEALNPTTRLESDSTRPSRMDKTDPTTPPLRGVGESENDVRSQG